MNLIELFTTSLGQCSGCVETNAKGPARKVGKKKQFTQFGSLGRNGIVAFGDKVT